MAKFAYTGLPHLDHSAPPLQSSFNQALMFSVLTLGFLIGMQHAFEADHVAAVASIATGRRSFWSIVRQGIAWAVGHTLTLATAVALVIAFGAGLDGSMAAVFEFLVGLMLIGLGAQVLHRLWRDRSHFHAHDHDGQGTHFHLHAHRGDTMAHDLSAHDHRHPDRTTWRTLFVGMMHGLAGSAALLLLPAITADKVGFSLVYVGLFGVGSIVGMAVLSGVIAVPLRLTAGAKSVTMTWANRMLQLGVGVLTIAVGAYVAVDNSTAVFALV